ncbi:hypothetical protein O181_028945 [Austropuccinia psidii MF-1]|uniref:Uncharacterized protein n=1 Tax=Austropuccinia psidii MF-1 TaxID=1389203 RepID=A0A9Q3CUC5_9BASI|nr:hypothetical protein [Austropuccinia psidii MF-1]
MHPVLKVAGVVHIWYYILLCTIFAQKFNGDVFRTKFHLSKSRSQNPTPISNEDSLAHQSGNQKTIQGSQSPGPAGVGLAISLRIIPRVFSEVIQSFNQFSRHQVFQYSLDNSIGSYRHQSINLYVLGPIGPIQSSTVGIKSHSSISRWPELYWPNSDNTADDPPSRISLSVFHIYWPPFRTWGLFPQSHAIVLDRWLPMSEVTGSRQRDVARWTNIGRPFPVSGSPIHSSSEVLNPRINTEGVVKQIRRIANSPPDPDYEGSDELDGEEVEVVYNSAGQQSSTSITHPPAKRFQSKIIPSTPRTFQPILSTITTTLPPASPNSSTTRLALVAAVRPSPLHQSRNSPIVTSQHLQ